jgi:Tol biopolymer transport system component
MTGLFQELRRRNVIRVAAAYLALAWLALQVIDTLKGILDLPDWVGLYSLVALFAGFPIAVFLAWAYELTPEGIRAAEETGTAEPLVRFGGRKIDFVIIGALSIVIVLLLLQDRIAPSALPKANDPPLVTEYTQLTRSPIIFPPTPSPVPLVADSSRLYFNDFSLGTLGVLQLAQAGGEAVRFDTSLHDPEFLFNPTSMTPDKSGLLMHGFLPGQESTPDMIVFPIVGGSPRLLGKGAGGTYSVDGSRIAFTHGSDEIFVANSDMSDTRKILTAPAKVYWIEFSPDGKRIRYFVSGEKRGIWEASVEGDDPHVLLPNWTSIDHCCGSWTPDGRYYVFQAVHENRSRIWAIRESPGTDGESSEPVQITSGALDFRRPTIAPDGKTIHAVGWQLRGEIVRYDATVERFVPIPGFESVSGEWFSYSSNGDSVAYVSYPSADLWRSDSDGGGRVQVTFPPMQTSQPRWSPDGRYIAFSGKLADQPWQVYIVSTAGGSPQPVTQDEVFEGSPTWSPDSTSLAFSRAGEQTIQLYDVETGAVTALPDSDGLVFPDWSPDGHQIAAYSEGSLVVLDVESGQRNSIVGPDMPLEGFYWDSDSQHLYLIDPFWKGFDRSIHRINIDSKVSETVLKIGNIRSAWGVWNMWIGIAPDGEPMLLRDLSIHHIYALDWLP